MVPGSTFRYGSNFIRLTLSPRLSSRHPIEAAARPLPKEDTTPPVTKMYLADIASSLNFGLESCAGWRAQSIMPEKAEERNVEKQGFCLLFRPTFVAISIVNGTIFPMHDITETEALRTVRLP